MHRLARGSYMHWDWPDAANGAGMSMPVTCINGGMHGWNRLEIRIEFEWCGPWVARSFTRNITI